MTLGGTFLAGATGRLLPASIPFRFFASAAAFHVLMWLALLAGAGQITGFRGGLGPVLAAIHLLTLGVLVPTAIGASIQLLPVATRRPFSALWPIKLTFWLVVPGTVALAAGMYVAVPDLLVAGAALVTAGLVLYAGILVDNLRRATGLPVASAYGWAALTALILVVALGLALAVGQEAAILPDHANAALAHMILGGFGFMGFLALGFSEILVPMFALAPTPRRSQSVIGFLLAVIAVAVGAPVALVDNSTMLAAAGSVGLVAAGVHLWSMHRALATGMRKHLGISFVLVRVAWIALPAALIVGLAALYGVAGRNGGTLFGFLLLGGWLLTFVLGIMQRIMPFLASMHASRSAGGKVPRLS